MTVCANSEIRVWHTRAAELLPRFESLTGCSLLLDISFVFRHDCHRVCYIINEQSARRTVVSRLSLLAVFTETLLADEARHSLARLRTCITRQAASGGSGDLPVDMSVTLAQSICEGDIVRYYNTYEWEFECRITQAGANSAVVVVFTLLRSECRAASGASDVCKWQSDLPVGSSADPFTAEFAVPIIRSTRVTQSFPVGVPYTWSANTSTDFAASTCALEAPEGTEDVLHKLDIEYYIRGEVAKFFQDFTDCYILASVDTLLAAVLRAREEIALLLMNGSMEQSLAAGRLTVNALQQPHVGNPTERLRQLLARSANMGVILDRLACKYGIDRDALLTDNVIPERQLARIIPKEQVHEHESPESTGT